jgi:hypothetical protein
MHPVWAADFFNKSDVPPNHNSEKYKLWAFNFSFVDGTTRKDPRLDVFLKRALRVRSMNLKR